MHKYILYEIIVYINGLQDGHTHLLAIHRVVMSVMPKLYVNIEIKVGDNDAADRNCATTTLTCWHVPNSYINVYT